MLAVSGIKPTADYGAIEQRYLETLFFLPLKANLGTRRFKPD